MKDLPNKPTLADYQALIVARLKDRGFEKETPLESFMIMVEEVGELAKAMRKHIGHTVDKNSKEHSIEEEAADVLWTLLAVCHHLNIDLEKAFREKEEKNKIRKWQ